MWKALLILFAVVCSVLGHGRLWIPPNRSSIWRNPSFAHLNPPANYDDMGLYCGARHQENDPGNECGVCGDPISTPTPRANEIGGQFDRGIIVANYTAGQVIPIEVQLTAAHLGAMEFRLCANTLTETQACFNQNLLQRSDGAGSKIQVTNGPGTYRANYRLPANVRCNRCIIQWNYRAGNNPGPAQETFRGCADVKIS